ncbi:MAG: DNA sulfur modification protein DndB [Planctomycetota bacterium]|nr:DNA sulfur modification protein DndB [Planctomycetota bacterium]
MARNGSNSGSGSGAPQGVAPLFGYVFPAIRGIQARREYFVSMCPLRLLPKMFLFNEDELVPELRAQRILNKARIPEISRYVLENAEDYCFSAITASIDGDVKFTPLSGGTNPGAEQIGLLHVAMQARFIINDGQHRRAGIEQAIRERPELADETIAVVFFLDRGLERCQQMFADLKRNGIRPTKSLGLLYDHRDDKAYLARQVIAKSLFRDVVELERTTLSPRSRKLFTLASIYSATAALLQGTTDDFDDKVQAAVAYWDTVAAQFPEWQDVRDRKVSAGEIREHFVHSHGIALQAIGRVGNSLVREDPKGWQKRVSRLRKLDWSRKGNAKQWEGRVMIAGRISKSSQNVVLTTNLLKQHLDLQLTPEELRVENAYQRGELVHA